MTDSVTHITAKEILPKPTPEASLVHGGNQGLILTPARARAFQIIGIIAVIISSASLLPQVISVLTTLDVEGLSLFSFLGIATANAFWVAYHAIATTYHGLIASIINLLNALIISSVIIGIRYL